MEQRNIAEQLKELTPKDVSSDFKKDLLGRIQSEKSGDAVARNSYHWRLIPLAAAAVLLVALSLAMWWPASVKDSDCTSEERLARDSAEQTEDTNIYRPTFANTVLVAYESQPVELAGKSYTKEKYSFIDYAEWENEKEGVLHRVVRPREASIILAHHAY